MENENQTLISTINEVESVINNDKYKKILCSVSGGSDSDCLIDLISKVDREHKVDYVFFNTGLEYEATLSHLKELEEKYNIEIETIRPKTPIPIAVKNNGVPFLSKSVSCNIKQLQKYGFEWDDTDDYMYLIEKYCRKSKDKKMRNNSVKIGDYYYVGCIGAILWWCNTVGKLPWGRDKKDSTTFIINRNRYLKEFMIANPPTFNISADCCNYVKKDLSKLLMKYREYDLSIIGVRKAEGGIRKTTYKCTIGKIGNTNQEQFRPLLYWTNKDKEQYKKENGIEYSKCYEEYGFTRTGCCCCPFGKDFNFELEQVKEHEPKLYNACKNIFKDSYEYSNKYQKFVKEQRLKRKLG